MLLELTKLETIIRKLQAGQKVSRMDFQFALGFIHKLKGQAKDRKKWSANALTDSYDTLDRGQP